MTTFHNICLLTTIIVVVVVSIAFAKPFTDDCQQATSSIPGKCVHLTKCRALFQLLLRQNLTETEKQFLRDSHCGNRNEQPLVCCSPDAIQREIPSQQVAARQSETLFPVPGSCGIQSTARIFGGTKATIGEFPWTALIKYRNKFNQSSFQCSGALINAKYVVTAAHCINGVEIHKFWYPMEVRLGEWDLSTGIDCIVDGIDFDCADPHLDVKIQQIIVHESYIPTSPNQYHDIALLRLTENIPFTEFIRPICLPFADHLRKQDFTKLKFWVAGWGRTEKSGKSNVLMKLLVPGFDTQQCSKQYKGERIFITSNQLCAGGQDGKDSCSGDSGAALMTIDTEEGEQPYWYLAGMVSFGPKPCGMKGWPGVYTKISEYIEWIEAHVKY
ncbi:serine protease easter-like [Culicoides brevitarsis]|uniref:serine protease easter-like n=1 Tax=Culicoides brevitarsis TaxID=469753 RepID=UPI00307BB2CC